MVYSTIAAIEGDQSKEENDCWMDSSFEGPKENSGNRIYHFILLSWEEAIDFHPGKVARMRELVMECEEWLVSKGNLV